MPVDYCPSLAQVLSIENIMDQDIIGDTINTRSIGSALKHLKTLFTNKISFYDGANHVEIYQVGTQLFIETNAGGGLVMTNTAAPIFSIGQTGNITAYGDIKPSGAGKNIGWATIPFNDLFLAGNYKPAITNFNHQEIIEHCDIYMDEYVLAAGSGNKRLNNISFNATSWFNHDHTTYRFLTAATTWSGIYVSLPNLRDPAVFTYYQAAARFWISDNVYVVGENFFSVNNMAYTNQAFVCKGTNANTIKFTTTNDALVSEENTDNIACDLTAVHKLEIRIKIGEICLYLDDVLVATHTTEIFFNDGDGVYPNIYFGAGEDAVKELYLDYIAIQLGRAF